MDVERYLTEDYHTAGEPFRLVVSGVPDIPGTTVAARRAHAMVDPGLQRLRTLLCHEPRGHADMYGGFLTPPDDDGALTGVLFWHKDGFSTACGHGTIALGVWAFDTGRVAPGGDGVTEVCIDVPSGRVTALLRVAGGRVTSVGFRNVPGWLHATGVPVRLADRTVAVDIAYGGAMYAVLPAAALGLRIRAGDHDALVAAGRAIRARLDAAGAAEHPTDPRLSGIYGTVFVEPVCDDEAAASPGRQTPAPGGRVLHHRTVTVFADGQVDRSPCGSGTAARVAQLVATGEMTAADVLWHESIVGSFFTATVHRVADVEGRVEVVAEVDGMAYRTGTSTFVVDPDDPLVPGFVLR